MKEVKTPAEESVLYAIIGASSPQSAGTRRLTAKLAREGDDGRSTLLREAPCKPYLRAVRQDAPVFFRLSRAFYRRLKRVRRARIRPSEIEPYLLKRLGNEQKERVLLLLFNKHGLLCGSLMMENRSAVACDVDEKRLYRYAFLYRAASVMLAHNHPGDDPIPSAKDHHFTDQMRRGFSVFDIPLLGHYLVSGGKVVPVGPMP